MTDTISTRPSATQTPGAAGSLPEFRFHIVRASLARPFQLLLVWQERLKQRQALAEMEPFRLDDMGIGRGAARREAAKPFWRA